MRPINMWVLLQIAEFQAQLEEDGEIYTDEHGIVRCKHDRDVMGSCIACVEESRQGLPPCYALWESAEGWFFIWKNPDPRFEEDTWSEGPFGDKEEARWEAWEDYEDRMMRNELDEEGRRVVRKSQ